MMQPLIKQLLSAFAICVLAGCMPNPTLEPHHTAPPVTGPFDTYFPNADIRFKGGDKADEVEADERQQAYVTSHVPDKGEIPIGLLIPKTGPDAELGKDFMDAAMLALYDAKLAHPGGYRLTLIPKDTASSPSVAVEAAQALTASKVPVIVGPLYGQSAQAINNTIKPPLMIPLSNNIDAAGEQSFVFGFTPEAEMTRAITYALKQGNHRIAAILPNNAYGRKLEKVIRASLPSFGATLDTVEYYVDSDAGRKAASERLAERIRQLSIDIVCFGDTKKHAIDIIDFLYDNNADIGSAMKVGTSLWHADTTPTPQKLNIAVYAASDQRAFNRFAKRFQSAYNRKPKRLSILVYDAITLLAEIASKGNIPSRDDLMALDIVQGPASGAYRFESDGTVVRGLSVYYLTPDSYDVIENAPKHF